jgi:phosphoadenosine phosphosulfate reductase
MLVDSPRYRSGDLEAWRHLEAADAVYCETAAFLGIVDRARARLASWVGAAPFYGSVSWGKDSTVVAHMIRDLFPAAPLAYVRAEPDGNPDCLAVRDLFLAAHPGPYYELAPWRAWNSGGDRLWGFGKENYAILNRALGPRRVTGIRAAESAQRRAYLMIHGGKTENTCAPLIGWKGRDVYAYLFKFGLPVHPAYACNMRGGLDRDRIRVTPIGGEPGRDRGRHEWERLYYPEVVSRLGQLGVQFRF